MTHDVSARPRSLMSPFSLSTDRRRGGCFSLTKDGCPGCPRFAVPVLPGHVMTREEHDRIIAAEQAKKSGDEKSEAEDAGDGEQGQEQEETAAGEPLGATDPFGARKTLKEQRKATHPCDGS